MNDDAGSCFTLSQGSSLQPLCVARKAICRAAALAPAFLKGEGRARCRRVHEAEDRSHCGWFVDRVMTFAAAIATSG